MPAGCLMAQSAKFNITSRIDKISYDIDAAEWGNVVDEEHVDSHSLYMLAHHCWLLYVAYTAIRGEAELPHHIQCG